MKFGELTYDDYTQKIKAFHGTVAPGILLGGFMVNLAMENLPKEGFYDVICETKTCLPDAIQLLTPCSIGNGWLKVLDHGRYAAIFYDKYTGVGIRITIDKSELEKWGEIHTWFLKLKPKHDQDSDLLFAQMRQAGTSVFSMTPAKVHQNYLKKEKMGKTTTCPICNETYPAKHGSICRGCASDLPYDLIQADQTADDPANNPTEVLLTKTPVAESVGMHLLHDVTRIIYKKEKGVAFKKGHEITTENVQMLRELGKNNLFVAEHNPFVKGYVHEDEAALAFADQMCGLNMNYNPIPKEGRINLVAESDGIFVADEAQLQLFNESPGVICATLPNYTVVKKGEVVAATRAIPLYISHTDYLKALNCLKKETVFAVHPLKKAKVGILITGTEVFENLVEDKYTEIMQAKVEAYGCEVVAREMAPDNVATISDKIHQMIQYGADLIITTAGLSVDPDDMTLEAIINAGAKDLLYGVPVLPGSMLVTAKIDDVQIVGVPGCGIYNDRFSFDLLFPRLLADLDITTSDLAKLGNGGLFYK